MKADTTQAVTIDPWPAQAGRDFQSDRMQECVMVTELSKKFKAIGCRANKGLAGLPGRPHEMPRHGCRRRLLGWRVIVRLDRGLIPGPSG